MVDHPLYERLIGRLEQHATLSDADRKAVLGLNLTQKAYQSHEFIVREGVACTGISVILEGFAIRQRVTSSGSRQILSFHVSGNFLNLEGVLLNVVDHNVQALGPCEVAVVSAEEINALIDAYPQLARALWAETLIDSSLYREWIVNLGRRSARERIAHLFCEMAKRRGLAGHDKNGGFQLPMTQEQLADATGLTPVHVNRMLKALEQDGLIARTSRSCLIPDWKKLTAEAGFDPQYMHIDQAA